MASDGPCSGEATRKRRKTVSCALGDQVDDESDKTMWEKVENAVKKDRTLIKKIWHLVTEDKLRSGPARKDVIYFYEYT